MLWGVLIIVIFFIIYYFCFSVSQWKEISVNLWTLKFQTVLSVWNETFVIVVLCLISYLVRLGLIFAVLDTMGMLCLCHLGFIPFGPNQYYLWYKLMWDKILRLDLVLLLKELVWEYLYVWTLSLLYIYFLFLVSKEQLIFDSIREFIRSHFRLIWIVLPKVW